MLRTRKRAIISLIASICPLTEFSLKEIECRNSIYDIYKLYLKANDNFYFEFWYSTESTIDGQVKENFKYEYSTYEKEIVVFPEFIQGDDSTTFEDILSEVSAWLEMQVKPYLLTVEQEQSEEV